MSERAGSWQRSAARLVVNLTWQFGVPGLGLIFFAYRDRYDGRPDYVVPWFLFAIIVGTSWTIPLLGTSQRLRSPLAIPVWVWPWLALTGVLLYRR